MTELTRASPVSPRLQPALHEQAIVDVKGDAERVFDFLDDAAHLAGHMARRSWMLGGGWMALQMDDGRGRKVGSRMRLEGSAFGRRLSVRTEVVEHRRPVRKSWQTLGTPRLIVMGRYRMSFEVQPIGSRVRVVISLEYSLPMGRSGAVRKWLARRYARWCVARMAADVAEAFR